MYLNRGHAKRREQLGKSAQVVDESMMGKSQMAGSKTVDVEDGEGATRAKQQKTLEEDNALRDMTDMKNEDFIYVY